MVGRLWQDEEKARWQQDGDKMATRQQQDDE